MFTANFAFQATEVLGGIMCMCIYYAVKYSLGNRW